MGSKKGILLFILCIVFQIGSSQVKNEKEERIQLSKFPNTAQELINMLPNQCKRLRFYKETDGTKESYETKFKYKKKRYSLEFSNSGIIEDIEVTIKVKELPKDQKLKLLSYFENTFKSYKFIKIQKQFVYNVSKSASDFVNDVLSQSSQLAYNLEIIAEVKTDGKRDIKEFTFDPNLKYVKSRILNPTSYEHVLY